MQDEYNFDADAEKTFSGLMDSIRDTGSATALLGAAGIMAFAAELATQKSPLMCATPIRAMTGCMHCQPSDSACIRPTAHIVYPQNRSLDGSVCASPS